MSSPSASVATYGLLGLLATRSWTGYELTQQYGRSLRFVWPTSEAHLYREQRRLVDLGWAAVEEEPAGRRQRKRYTITASGRAALQGWLATEPAEPRFQVEGILRTFHGDHGGSAELAAAMRATADEAGRMLDEMLGFVDDYLADAGPLVMLEEGREPEEFRGRPMFPERLHVVAAAIDVTTRLLHELEEFFGETAAEVAGWPDPHDRSLTPATRDRLEAIRDRGGRRGRGALSPRGVGSTPPARSPRRGT
jgi:DNA-binding PadR family transcriptional regulator